MIVLYVLLWMLCSSCIEANNGQRAVTYELPAGRLGDQLLAYMHAKWISYQYDIPLLYKPFYYSSEFPLDEQEQPLDPQEPYHTIPLKNLDMLGKKSNSDALFIVPYFPESEYERKSANWAYFPVDWQDTQFISLLRSLISPKVPFEFPPLPKDRVTVAAHVRRGGGYDDPSQQRHWPLKFPPDDFYIEQIRKIHKLLQKPLFVHIFTDDFEPERMAKDYAAALSDIDVVFEYRLAKGTYQDFVLYDLFDMMRYQCLIRPESNYSIVVEKLGNCKIVAHPVHCVLKNKKVVITKTNLAIKD
jgi:hypothetical protein